MVHRAMKLVNTSCGSHFLMIFHIFSGFLFKEDLIDKREVTLLVVKLQTLDQTPMYDHQLMYDSLEGKEHFILDIDLVIC